MSLNHRRAVKYVAEHPKETSGASRRFRGPDSAAPPAGRPVARGDGHQGGDEDPDEKYPLGIRCWLQCELVERRLKVHEVNDGNGKKMLKPVPFAKYVCVWHSSVGSDPSTGCFDVVVLLLVVCMCYIIMISSAA